MASFESFAAHDVVLVPFPFSDRLAEKKGLPLSFQNLTKRHATVTSDSRW